MDHVQSMVRLTFDKAAAHIGDPGKYPLPADPDAFEHAFARRLSKLPPDVQKVIGKAAGKRLSAPAQSRTYGTYNVLKAEEPTPIMARALAQPVPDPVRAAADEFRQRVAAVKPRDLQPSPTSVPVQVDLVLTEVTCKQKTKGEVGRDEIDMAAVGHDVYHQKDNTLAPFRVGQFNTGDRVTLSPAKVLASFPVVGGAVGGAVFPVTVHLAEVDFGGFAKFVEDVRSVSDHELQELLLIGGMTGLTGLAGSPGIPSVIAALANGEDLKDGLLAAISSGLLGPLGTGLLFTAASLPRDLVQALVGGVIGTAFLAVRDWLTELFGDEIFPPVPISLFLDPQTAKPNVALQPQTLTFTLRNGKSEITGVYEAKVEWRVKFGPLAGGLPPAGPKPAEARTEKEALDNLAKIKHVVVLMLENRSFDQMLGFLSIDRGRAEVDGLKPGMFNTLSATGQKVEVSPIQDTAISTDPGHDILHVGPQVWGTDFWSKFNKATIDDDVKLPPTTQPIVMSGFVDDFKGVRFGAGATLTPQQFEDLKLVMGYYPNFLVPAYDLLATEFAVCDKWHSSFPGSTWVNRTIALTGAAGTRTDGRTKIANNDMPFDEAAFVRVLDANKVNWAWYAQDVPSLLPVDLSFVNASGSRYRGIGRFFKDVENGTLPQVSWIDPNFIDIGEVPDTINKLFLTGGQEKDSLPYGFLNDANDDHPPGDITHGQNLVLQVVLGLMKNPDVWRSTMLVVTYDEHGGFYDHVPPPPLAAGVPPESPAFAYHGVRVPALIVSPWVGRGMVSSRPFDHSTIIRTILETFCRKGNTIPDVGPRVKAANHLGWLLSNPTPRLTLGPATTAAALPGALHDPAPGEAAVRVKAVRSAVALRVIQDRKRKPGRPAPTPTELQVQIREARKRLLAAISTKKVPAGQPG
jgi:phospholipase C